MLYTITGLAVDGEKTATRKWATSALVLAMKWQERGMKDVRIASPGKPAQNVTEFRAQLYSNSPLG